MPTKPRPFSFEKQYKYFRFYVPKHDRSEGTIWCYSAKEFLDKLVSWNRLQPTLWMYGPTEAPIGDL